MKTKQIAVNTTQDIQALVDSASHVNGSIKIETENNAKFDASSILGLFSVAPGSTMAVTYPESAEEFDDFLATLELTVASRGY